MNKLFSAGLVLCFIIISSAPAQAQYDPVEGCVIDISSRECLPNTILSAMPFLRIIPDARSGAMGDAGIALDVDPNAMHFNSSKLAFVEQDVGLSATYTPWLRDLGLNDVYLTYLSGFKQIDELSTVGFGLRFFSLGDIQFTDNDGNPSGEGKPRELEFAVAYGRKLAENFSVGLTGKYIYSNLASGQAVGGIDISSANAFAVDLSMYYKKDIKLSSYDSKLAFGLTISDVGSKVSYTASTVKDFLPMNIGLGTALTMNFDEFNKITVALDINKLLLPTPVSQCNYNDVGICIENPDYDNSGEEGIADYREQSMFAALLGSFGDAQGGFGEEIKEFNYSLGLEYFLNMEVPHPQILSSSLKYLMTME